MAGPGHAMDRMVWTTHRPGGTPVRPALLDGGGPAVTVNLRHRPVTSA